MQATDEQLVARCREGDAAAFDSLVERYQRKVLGLCLRHLRNYEEACDQAQEVFVQVFKHLPDFEGRSSFSTWLYRVCLNACYNRGRYWKAKGRGAVTSLDGLLERKEGGPDSSGLLRDKSKGALEALQLSEDLAQLRQAMDALDDDHRKVVDLVDIEELSYDEAAKVLDLPLNTVRSRLSRARQQLKVKLTRLRKRLGD
ncbi:MAG TPA: sigma-70 family RNA polymerase sigma factor [bacterium]|jgi:RNA polymerase sigma-70 factor (ECF subfamily)|nr:sigma-70 family RNA polymerase sigma factor [bacterium]